MLAYHWSLLVRRQVLRRAYSVEADIWSLGVMLYILLSGLPPFWGDTEEDIFRMVLKARAPSAPRCGHETGKDASYERSCRRLIHALCMRARALQEWLVSESMGRYGILRRVLSKRVDAREAGAQGDIDFKTAPWPSISEAAKDCVRKLLTMDPAHRPTAQQILEARCPALWAWVPT